MGFPSSNLRLITRPIRTVMPALADADDPHSEWLTLFWGSRFDREHARALWADTFRSQFHDAQQMRDVLEVVGDQFDALSRDQQQRLRRLILRHRERVLHTDLSASRPVRMAP